MSTQTFYGTGRRKTSVARVWVKSGEGIVKINKRALEEYFSREILRTLVRQPFEATDTLGKYDVMATVKGGGLTGQAEAVRHGIARALLEIDATLRPYLKKANLLTRDPRKKERKKYGQKAARKRFQYTKR
jgi:small subunit ribosomal protein S9